MKTRSESQRILRKSLGKAGFAVDAVAPCADARAALEVCPYDVGILDLALPDGDGLELLGELRSNGNHIPCLVLTARDTVEDRVNGLDTGADDYLVKPFAMTELIAASRRCCAAPEERLERRSERVTSISTRLDEM